MHTSTIFTPLYISHNSDSISPEEFIQDTKQGSCFIKKINFLVKNSTFFPVGKTKQECMSILNQHSWYKWALSALIIEMEVNTQVLGAEQESESMHSDALLACKRPYYVLRKKLTKSNCIITNLFNGRQKYPRGVRPTECYSIQTFNGLDKNNSMDPGIYYTCNEHGLKALVVDRLVKREFDISSFINKELLEKYENNVVSFAYNNQMRLAFMAYVILFKERRQQSIQEDLLQFKEEAGTDVPAYKELFKLYP
jgi:hypothetical protein